MLVKWMPIALVIGLSVIIAACGSTLQGGAPEASSAPTTATTPASPGAIATTASADSDGSPSAAPGEATAAPAAQPGGDDVIRFVVDPNGSEARYRVREQLARLSFPSDAVGTTKAISGQIVVRPDGTVVSEESKVVVDLQTLTSDENRRDNYIKNNTLQTSRFPTAEFVPTQVRGLPSPLPTSGEGTFQLIGNLTVHGVTRPVTWDVTARLDGGQMTGTATTSFTFGDFGMTVPQVFVVLSVEDNIRLELDFQLVRQS